MRCGGGLGDVHALWRGSGVCECAVAGSGGCECADCLQPATAVLVAVLAAVGSEPAIMVSGRLPGTAVPLTRMVTGCAVAPLLVMATLCCPVALV